MNRILQTTLVLLIISFSQNAFSQKDSTKQLEEVVVTGQYAPQLLRNSVYKVKTITAERIKMRAATDVTGVLNSELGIRFSTDNTLGESDTKIMGLGGSRVKVLIDGVPMVDRDATKQSLTQIDINSIERIEIVEGPMSVTYGTDALAGVINIITKKAKKTGSNLSVIVRMQEESIADIYSPLLDDGIHNENVTVNWNNSHWRASGYITRNDFGGSADTMFPAKVFKPKKQWMGGGSLGYGNNKVNVWYRLDYLNEELFAASPMNPSSYRSFRQYYITNRYTHQAQMDWSISTRTKLNSTVSYQDYRRNTESYTRDYKNNITETNNSADDLKNGYWDVSKFQTLFVRNTLAWMISPKVSLQPGMDIKYDKTSGQRVLGEPSIMDYSVFASAEIKPNDVWNIRPGLRFSKNSVYDAPPVIPSINTKIMLSKKLDLRLSYARGFRAPILRELYFKFDDVNHKIFGNPNLKAETSNSFIATVTCNAFTTKSMTFTSSISGFFNDYSNFIDLSQKAATDTFSYFNISKYKTVGGTFDNTILWKGLTANIGFSYIGYYNQFEEDNSLKGNKSKFTWSPEITTNLTYKLEKLKANIGLYYKFTGKIPSYQVNSSNDIVLSQRDALHWADLTATKQVFKQFTLQAGIKNLFNVTNLSNSAASSGAHSSGSTTFFAYGRSYFLGITFQWSKNSK